MKRLNKVLAGLALATAATVAVATPSMACGCDTDDGGYGYAYGWGDVGDYVWIDRGGSTTFQLELDAHQTLDIGFVSELIQGNYAVDLDITIVYPDGRTVSSDDVGDDELTIRTGRGGVFTITISNIDDSLGTDFYLYVA